MNIKAQNKKFLKLLFVVKKVAEALSRRIKHNRRGRPRKFNLFQIIACLVYKVKKGIKSFRELEYRINQDIEFKRAIGIEESPNYSYFAKLLRKIEEKYMQDIREILIAEIEPDISIAIVDSTPLRSAKNDSEAKIDIHITIGFFRGYKLHLLCAGKEEVIPLFWILTGANEHDSRQEELLYRAWGFGCEIVLADAGYDCSRWFNIANELKVKFVAGINKRNMKDKNNVSNSFRSKNIRFLETEEGKKLYRHRTKIERLFSKLKGEYNLENVRLKGFRNYKRYIDWILITFLFEQPLRKLEGKKFSSAYEETINNFV